ncbi:hypothetical protein RI367_003638 [Sorochytrium milnesiophthora]
MILRALLHHIARPSVAAVRGRFLTASTALRDSSEAPADIADQTPKFAPLLARRERINIALQEADLEEKFIRGGGNGGQKINKTSNCVELRHTPTGLILTCQATRSLSDNRRIARKLMLAKLDDYLNGDLSRNAQRIKKEQNKKRKKQQKSRKKYGHGSADEVVVSSGNEEPI